MKRGEEATWVEPARNRRMRFGATWRRGTIPAVDPDSSVSLPRRISVWTLPGICAALVISCAASKPRPTPPTFTGVETEAWLVEESAPVNRDDVLLAFKVAARNYGCSTEELGNAFGANIQGEYRSYYGISASCGEGAIALITLQGGGVRIGCSKPTTREACDQLLRSISQGR
jgi:hypothetical protein